MTYRAIAPAIFAIFVLGVGMVAVVARAFTSPPRVEQPVAFSHRTHSEGEGLECLECHSGAAEETWAGMPDIGECYECHKSAQGDDPESDVAVREYARRDEQIPFVHVNRNVGHVYFSHRMHVAVAEMECDSCHPGYETRELPTTMPRADLVSMRACMSCHEQEGANNECVVCHK